MAIQRVERARVNEAQLQNKVLELAGKMGLLAYHTYDSRRSVAGFPDLVIVGHNGVLYRELKSAVGRISSDQKFWIAALSEAGQDVDVWRPADWPMRVQADLHGLGRLVVRKPEPSQEQVRKMLATRISGDSKFPGQR